ncbi:phosphatidate cytidylyltransferase [Ornithinibacillus bavariensis]|uniref:Phosphatidate cytidylyltransferase n=1 Tax=Ornithinibacillus bavariensis TaxID=545502 RepID=A0A920C502_9BACI|nr:phosphatidate cytidylyltransferase [Ornithinibacillus bavariensis]GIO26185.1 phosphatidate cytidylyltransferase [Ornithinibacillus bavariensis]HAM79425.1 phosphatidate cytidylyltransferase [Ornithinibacillus sp.]
MKQRILTAIVALILFIPFVIYGGWPFAVAIYLLATIGLTELLKMHKVEWNSFPGLLAIIFLWLLLYPATNGIHNINLATSTAENIVLFVLLLLAYTVLLKNKFTFDDVGFILLAVLYVGMGFFYFLETRNAVNGLAQIFFTLILIWSTDTGAYFTGRAIGKHKLWPEISPNKTIEGAIGGIILASIVGVIFHLIFPFPFSIVTVIIISIVVSVFGQIGDLVESAFKRHYNVKDSGKILPGHGGILDRFDSAIFVFPVLQFILQLL